MFRNRWRMTGCLLKAVSEGFAATGDQSTSSIVGDFNAEYKLSEDGRLRIKAFNKSNTSNFSFTTMLLTTQGFGVFYREEFNTFRQLLEHYKLVKKKKDDAKDSSSTLK